MTEQALLAAVLASPDDDAPRLIFADFLDEQGRGERAEFIRVQIELARIGFLPDGTVRTGCREDDDRERALRRREGELLKSGGDWWLVPLVEITGPFWFFDATDRPVVGRLAVFRRGFVHSVTCSAEDWLRHGDAILSAQPVEVVRLINPPRQPFESAYQLTYCKKHYRDHHWVELNADGIARKVEIKLPDDSRGFGFDGLRLVLSHAYPRVKTWELPPPQWRGASIGFPRGGIINAPAIIDRRFLIRGPL